MFNFAIEILYYMEVLNTIKPSAYYPKNKRVITENQQFEQMWKNSISGDEFVLRSHEHIKGLYALRDKQQATDY